MNLGPLLIPRKIFPMGSDGRASESPTVGVSEVKGHGIPARRDCGLARPGALNESGQIRGVFAEGAESVDRPSRGGYDARCGQGNPGAPGPGLASGEGVRMATEQDKMERIVALAKRRGFIFPGSEIYGGRTGSGTTGPWAWN